MRNQGQKQRPGAGGVRSLKDRIYEELDIFALERRGVEGTSSEFRQWKDHSRREA